MSQTLTVHAEKSLNQFCSELAKAYQVEQPALAKMFSVVGPMETTLRKAILASVEFLGLITCLDVDQITGQVVQVGVGQLYTGRKKGGRFKGEVGVDGNKYELKGQIDKFSVEVDGQRPSPLGGDDSTYQVC